jgi:uncharacterized membrane protein
MRRIVSSLILGLFLIALAAPTVTHAQVEQPVVRAVMFYSPSCPHCHVVLQEGLPPLVEKYGDQLQIMLIDVTTPGGQELYQAAARVIPIPENRRGVPALIVGDTLLVGDVDIPEQLPAIIDAGLAGDGIDWPAIPGLDRAIAQIEAQSTAEEPTSTAAAVDETAQPATEPQTTSAAGEEARVESSGAATLDQVDVRAVSEMSIAERLALDPMGAAIALVTLALMVVMLIWALIYWMRTGMLLTEGPRWLSVVIPLLAIIGAGVAFYLAFVETTGSEAVCGPVGDCNAVQQSAYARLFGVVHIGVLGLIGYAIILGLWAMQWLGSEALRKKTDWLLPAVIWFGVAFSAYLTFLEPFVIGAVCMWCITSALIMTALLYLTYRWRVPER